MKSLKSLAIFAVAAVAAMSGPALAAPAAPASGMIVKSGVLLAAERSASGAKVKGYTSRRGGYSYNQADSINTYGDSRSKYGGASSLRDSSLDKQTVAGPFDHGFFFDSGITARGGDSPYMN